VAAAASAAWVVDARAVRRRDCGRVGRGR